MDITYDSINLNGEIQREFIARDAEYSNLVSIRQAYEKKGFKTWINPYDHCNWILTVIKKEERKS